MRYRRLFLVVAVLGLLCVLLDVAAPEQVTLQLVDESGNPHRRVTFEILVIDLETETLTVQEADNPPYVIGFEQVLPNQLVTFLQGYVTEHAEAIDAADRDGRRLWGRNGLRVARLAMRYDELSIAERLITFVQRYTAEVADETARLSLLLRELQAGKILREQQDALGRLDADPPRTERAHINSLENLVDELSELMEAYPDTVAARDAVRLLDRVQQALSLLREGQDGGDSRSFGSPMPNFIAAREHVLALIQEGHTAIGNGRDLTSGNPPTVWTSDDPRNDNAEAGLRMLRTSVRGFLQAGLDPSRVQLRAEVEAFERQLAQDQVRLFTDIAQYFLSILKFNDCRTYLDAALSLDPQDREALYYRILYDEYRFADRRQVDPSTQPSDGDDDGSRDEESGDSAGK